MPPGLASAGGTGGAWAVAALVLAMAVTKLAVAETSAVPRSNEVGCITL